MKKIKGLLIVLVSIILCGCQNKFNGTWCLYTEVPSSLVIFSDNVSNDDISTLTKYLESLKDVVSFDLIDNIESANKMFNIYYTSKDNIESYKEKISKYSFVKTVENKMINKAKEKIIVKDKTFEYGKNLNTLYATEIKGNTIINGNTITLDGTEFYYKDKFICADKDCTVIFTKSSNDCN